MDMNFKLKDQFVQRNKFVGGNVTFGELQMQFSSVRTKNEWDQEKNGLQSDNEAAIYALQVNWLLFFFKLYHVLCYYMENL